IRIPECRKPQPELYDKSRRQPSQGLKHEVGYSNNQLVRLRYGQRLERTSNSDRHRTEMRSRFRVWSLPLRRPSRAGRAGRVSSYLSRRDLMIVATRLSSPKSTQFIAWIMHKKRSAPYGTV